VNLFHLSATDEKQLEEIVDLGLAYIWKTMHCVQIRVYLHHFMQTVTGRDGKEIEKLAVNTKLRNLFKDRRFKWKTLKNDNTTGFRIEVMEGKNLEFKE